MYIYMRNEVYYYVVHKVVLDAGQYMTKYILCINVRSKSSALCISPSF